MVINIPVWPTFLHEGFCVKDVNSLDLVSAPLVTWCKSHACIFWLLTQGQFRH